MFAAAVLRTAATASSASSSSAGKQQMAGFSQAHKAYVKSLYRRFLKNQLDWVIRRDIWRDRAIEIRVEFERHRNVRNPRELASLFQKAEAELERVKHPDPYKSPMFEDGTKWERNVPPPIFSEAEKKAALEALEH